MSMRHWCGARGSSLSKILSVLSSWANLATGKEYPGKLHLERVATCPVSLSRWLPGVPE